jgi:hypothetical protein
MPAPVQQPSDPPKRSPSFVCEVPLRVSQGQERVLLARLEAARQVYNACLGQSRARARLVYESKAFRAARTLPREDPERKRLFAQARQQHAFSDYALQAFARPKTPGELRNRCCRRPISTPAPTNVRVDGICCPPLVSLQLIRVGARRLRQVG